MIQLSQTATQEILRLHSKSGHSEPRVRLSIQSSGCLTHAYAIAFDPTLHPTDQIYSSGGVQVVVQADHLPLLEGLRLDYSEDLMGGSFRFHNPNARQVCGCGNSFDAQEPPLV